MSETALSARPVSSRAALFRKLPNLDATFQFKSSVSCESHTSPRLISDGKGQQGVACGLSGGREADLRTALLDLAEGGLEPSAQGILL